MTTATDRLMTIISVTFTAEKSGIHQSGIPGSTVESVGTFHSFTGPKYVKSAPAAMSTTAIGNFGMIFLLIRSIASAIAPISSAAVFICFKVSHMCSASSKSSPVPAVPPISFGTCMSIIVVHIPVIKPPITGADI